MARADSASRGRGPEVNGERIHLPPMASGHLTVEQAIDHRRSVRRFSAQPVRLDEVSRLLHAANGITAPSYGYRSAPSAGALYPLEVYVVANHVTGLDQGVYHYAPEDHSLEPIRSGDVAQMVATDSLGQNAVAKAAVVIALAAVLERTASKYRARAERYVYMEAGHVAQNVLLEATSLGLGACAVGAFLDDELNRALEVDAPDESVIYLLTVGRP
jgi:SagB-type dehydrogenase family enzyme